MSYDHKRQKQIKEDQHELVLKQIGDRYMEEIKILKDSLSVVEHERDTIRDRNQRELVNIRHMNGEEFYVLEKDYGIKLKNEAEKIIYLQNQCDHMMAENQQQTSNLTSTMAVEIQTMKSHFELMLTEKKKQTEDLKRSTAHQIVVLDTNVKEIENDIDRERLELMTAYEKKILEERKSSEFSLGDGKQIKVDVDNMNITLGEYKTELSRHVQEEKRLQGLMKGYQKDIETVKKEIAERDESIKDKERRIFDLKKKNQELEKFKFVLDYKIDELHKQVAPKENDVASLAKYIEEMNKELQALYINFNTLNSTIRDLGNKLSSKSQELIAEKGRGHEMSQSIQNITLDLGPLIKSINDKNRLKVNSQMHIHQITQY